MSMSEETWPWYALQEETGRDWPLESTAPGRRLRGGVTYFSRVMMSRWPVKWRARRSARSLASELQIRGAKGHCELLSHQRTHSRPVDPTVQTQQQLQHCRAHHG